MLPYCLISLNTDVRVFFENDHYPVSETAGSVEMCVRREGDTTQSLTIQVSTEDLVPPQALGIFDIYTQHILVFIVAFVLTVHIIMYTYSWH